MADEKKGAGRPTKWTPELQAEVVAALKAGNYLETACLRVGISRQTLHNWLNRGRTGEAPYDGFLDAVEKAEAWAEVHALALIETAARDGVWQAAAWKLERKHQDRWGRQRMDMQHSGDVSVSLAFRDISEERAKAILEGDEGG